MSRYRFATTALAAMLLAIPSLADDAVTPHYLNVPGTDTKLKVYGFVQANAEEMFNQYLYPTGALVDGFSNYATGNQNTPTNQFTMSAHASRFGFATITPSAGMGDVTTKIELDFFHGTGSTTAQATLRLRHLVIGLGNWTVGYTWSNWVDLDADAETVDFIGPIGQAGDDTPRYAQIRYNFAIDKQNSLAVSLEENQNDGKWYTGGTTAATPANTVPSVKAPTVVAAYTYADSWGHLALRGMEQYWGAYTPAVSGQSDSVSVNGWAGAFQVSGSWNICKTDSVCASLYTGQGLGAYGTDNGYDAVFDMGKGTTNSVSFTKSTGWQAGWTHNWTDAWRTNVVLSGLTYSGDPNYIGQAANSDVKSSTNVFLNGIVKLTKSCELGMEYAYESATTFGSAGITNANGTTCNMVHSSKLQATLTASF